VRRNAIRILLTYRQNASSDNFVLRVSASLECAGLSALWSRLLESADKSALSQRCSLRMDVNSYVVRKLRNARKVVFEDDNSTALLHLHEARKLVS